MVPQAVLCGLRKRAPRPVPAKAATGIFEKRERTGGERHGKDGDVTFRNWFSGKEPIVLTIHVGGSDGKVITITEECIAKLKTDGEETLPDGTVVRCTPITKAKIPPSRGPGCYVSD
jgi:hypothetical protein